MYINITKSMLVNGYTQDFWALVAMRYDPKVLERKDGIFLTEANLQEFCDLFNPKKDFLSYLFQIADDGGVFGQVKLFVKLGNHLLEQPVPEGLSGRMGEDGKPLDWSNWGVTEKYDPFLPCKEQGYTIRSINPEGRFCTLYEILAVRHYCEYETNAMLLSPKMKDAFLPT